MVSNDKEILEVSAVESFNNALQVKPLLVENLLKYYLLLNFIIKEILLKFIFKLLEFLG